jgi:hypothetical protein
VAGPGFGEGVAARNEEYLANLCVAGKEDECCAFLLEARQVVSWLGENPNILREAQERYVDTTLGVLVTVLKASGYALVGCLGIGGLIGGLLFTYRRSQQKEVSAYSDAGGMLRLNLDELTTDLTDRRR